MRYKVSAGWEGAVIRMIRESEDLPEFGIPLWEEQGVHWTGG